MEQKPISYYFSNVEEKRKMHGVTRVIVFCVLIVLLPSTLIITPLYLRKSVFANVTYEVAESDVIEIRDGMSSIFCEKHSLSMNSKFSAFQLNSIPKMSNKHKHIRLKKSMTLPDDTFEYWGFYLLKGAKTHLEFCSRCEGSRILIIKGERQLSTCGLLDHNRNKLGAAYAEGHDKVQVFFEDITEVNDHLVHETSSLNVTRIIPMEAENHGGEDLDENIPAVTTVPTAQKTRKLRKKLKKGTRHTNAEQPKTTTDSSDDESEEVSRELIQRQKRDLLYNELYKPRIKREQVLDRRYSHGGNAANFTETDESNSVSSFETGLFECFEGKILKDQNIWHNPNCTSVHFLENKSNRMVAKHEVQEDGYYYYIFYSDNDLVRNEIHAIFDIYQVSFQYANLSGSQSCVNVTECTFPVNFLSDEIVVVEVPMRDGIENEADDITLLISTCHPRTEVYAIFPILVIVLILSCSFL